MQSLTKGGNAPVATDVVRVSLTWDRSALDFEVDATALLCGADGKVRSDEDFVFYNQRTHPSGSVWQLGFDYGDGTMTDTLEVDLARVPGEVEFVRISASTFGTFGQVPNLVAHVLDARTGTPLLEFPICGDRETAMVAGELYRRGGGWKFRAVGQGYADGLAGLARDFGITVDAPATPLVAPVPPPTQPQPQPQRPAQSGAIDWLNPPVPAGYEI